MVLFYSIYMSGHLQCEVITISFKYNATSLGGFWNSHTFLHGFIGAVDCKIPGINKHMMCVSGVSSR